METFPDSFTEERQPLDRKSTFREAARHAQERVVLENWLQELTSNLAAFTANNELLRKTLRNQDSLWSLQRLDSIQSQNVELTRSVKSLYFSLAPRINYGVDYKLWKKKKKDVQRAVQDFRSLLAELATQLQVETNSQRNSLENTASSNCVAAESRDSASVEEKDGDRVDNQISEAISFEEFMGDNSNTMRASSETRRDTLLRFLQNTETQEKLLDEFLGELSRKDSGYFNSRVKWSQVSCVYVLSKTTLRLFS